MKMLFKINALRQSVAGRKTMLFVEKDSINYELMPPSFLIVEGGKLVIFGIPKCGNAWLQSMLVKYFNVDVVIDAKDRHKRGILSIHDPFVEEMVYRTDFATGVCLIRDIRDVVVSYFHYARTNEFRRAMNRCHYEDIDSFYYEWFLSRCVPAHRLHTFADEYAERSIPLVRYERLQASPCNEMMRLLRRWGIEPDIEKIREIVALHQLENLKRSGLNLGYHVESSHFRKGGWGNFLNELPKHILQDMNVRFSDYLQRWGYPVDLTEENIDSFKAGLAVLGEE